MWRKAAAIQFKGVDKMSSISDYMEMQNRISNQINIYKIENIASKIYTPDVMDIMNKIQFDSGLQKVIETTEKLAAKPYWGEIAEAVAMQQNIVNNIVKPYSEVLNVIPPTNGLVSGLSEFSKAIKSLEIDTSVIDSINSTLTFWENIIPKNISYIETLYNLQDVLEAINLSENTLDLQDLTVDELKEISAEMTTDILAIAEGNNSDKLIDVFKTKWGERGKKVLLYIPKIIWWLFLATVGGFIQYCQQPCYQALKDIIMKEDSFQDSKDYIQISDGKQVFVWGDITQDYVEISYEKDGTTYQGYISKDDLENNMIKISNGVKIEEVVFVEYCIELMAEYWNISETETYNKLKLESNLIESYIIPNYAVLNNMEDADIIKEIEKEYCKLPVSGN